MRNRLELRKGVESGPFRAPFGVAMFDVSSSNPGPIDVRMVESPLDRDAVFQLRYRVLVPSAADLGRGFTESNGRLIEPADSGAEFVAAFGADGTALAALRRQPLLDVLKGEDRFKALLGVAHRLGSDPRRVSTSSRFIIDPLVYSGANLALRVFAAMLRKSAVEGMTHELCWADEAQQSGRLRLGYVDARTRILDTDGAPMQVLSLKVGRQRTEGSSIFRFFRRVMNAA